MLFKEKDLLKSSSIMAVRRLQMQKYFFSSLVPPPCLSAPRNQYKKLFICNCWLQLPAENGAPYSVGKEEDCLLVFRVFEKSCFYCQKVSNAR